MPGYTQKLGLLAALPCHPHFMPRPHLAGLLLRHVRPIFARGWATPAENTLIRVLHRLVGGNRTKWKTTD